MKAITDKTKAYGMFRLSYRRILRYAAMALTAMPFASCSPGYEITISHPEYGKISWNTGIITYQKIEPTK